MPPLVWLSVLAEKETSGAMAETPSIATPARPAARTASPLRVLDEAAFTAAVRDALRHYAEADGLLDSPLLETRCVVERSGNSASRAARAAVLKGVLREAIEALMPGGTCVLLGSAPPGTDVAIEMPFLQQGRIVRGVVQGESLPKEFIPRLVDLIVAGKFPIQKMIKFYDLADINVAAQESSFGITIKPVLRMPAGG